jgi:zinc protease
MSIPGPQDITRHELPNGIVILVRENHASPSAVVSGFLTVGSYDEQESQTGLAAFTAGGLTRGTLNRTFDQIFEQAESVGASIGVGAGEHRTSFRTKSLTEDLPLMMDILSDVLRNPTFPPQEIEKLRGQILTGLDMREDDTARMAALTFREQAYPQGHPYGRAVSGYKETISNLTRDDLADFYQGGFGPQGMLFVIVGGIKTKQAIAQVEKAFGDWEGPSYSRDPLPDAPAPDKPVLKHIPMTGKTQTDIVLGYPGPARSDPMFLDALLCNTVLGIFGLMGRLGEKIREEQGLAYYSYSQVDGGSGPGPWRVVAGVNPANTEQAVESIRAEIQRIREEPIPAEELADSQAFLVGSLPLRLETNEGVASAIMQMELYDLGLDYLQRYGDLINEITAARAQAAAQKWLDPDAYFLATAGPSTE